MGFHVAHSAAPRLFPGASSGGDPTIRIDGLMTRSCRMHPDLHRATGIGRVLVEGLALVRLR